MLAFVEVENESGAGDEPVAVASVAGMVVAATTPPSAAVCVGLYPLNVRVELVKRRLNELSVAVSAAASAAMATDRK